LGGWREVSMWMWICGVGVEKGREGKEGKGRDGA